MRSNKLKSEVRKDSRLAGDGISFFSSRQEMFRKLYKLAPDECLRSITGELKKALDCETVCILLWNEGKQKLITEFDNGMPESLDRAEEYGPQEGVTGAIIFSENRWVRCLIDMEEHRIDDMQMGTRIDDGSTNWHNMESFARNSAKGGFRSLLGAPFSVRSQKLGVVKLINKLNKNGQLDDDGFKAEDVKTLSYFLDAIEHVVEIKRNEKQVQSLLHVGQKIIGSDVGHKEVLEEIARRCADALNYRICLIRLLENDRLYVRASNLSLSGREDLDARHTPYLSAVELKIPLKGSYTDDLKGGAQLQLGSAEGLKKIKLSKINSRFMRFLHHHSLKSFLIVPIIRQSNVIGTIECYTSLQRDFSAQELNAIRLYVDALVITTINSRQQLLLTNLIELQRIGSVSDEGAGKEERVIAGVLSRMRELLGQRLKVLAVIFSPARLAQSKLACKELYGASRKELRDALGAPEFQRILDGLSGPARHKQAMLRSGKAGSGHAESAAKGFLKFDIPVGNECDPLGALVLGLHGTVSDDEFPHQVARLGAEQLGVLLTNIEEFRRSKELLKIINDAPLKNTLGDMYGFILNQTTDFFGFDFGAISKVDYIGRRVETVMSQSTKPDLVDPTEWMHLSSYGLDEKDLLTDVYESKKDVIINAARPGEGRDPRLNKEIYERFNHKDLARIWVPFTFRQAEGGSEKGDIVLGIIEAGYHRQTQERIDKQKRDLFVLFVDSCAKSLQRVALLEERQSIDDILKKFNQEAKPREVLLKLLQETVNIVRGDWGDITFLTHFDQKIRFLDDTISYKVPPSVRDRLAKELDVGIEGCTGIVGYVAATESPYWSNDVKKEPRYIEECPNVKSELAVPLRFYGRVIGVLNINSNHPDWFDERKANLVQTVADHATVFYQNAKMREPLYNLISPFNPFASTQEIYKQVVKIIEGYLGTQTVSVWKRHSTLDTYELELVAASDELWDKYQEAGLLKLKHDSFTGHAASGEETHVYANQKQIMESFTNPEFAEANGLRSMTAVPISVGEEAFGAIDVFSRRDTQLFAEELVILRILASKAAIALQSAMLVQSFNDIANISPNDHIGSILQRIAQNALDVLKADPVILFRYEAAGERFDPEAVVAGRLNYKDVRIVTNANDMANMVLRQEKTLYLKSEEDYLAFEHTVGRKWRSDRLPADFWHREKIKSLAALKLEHGDEVVGVMFINYREQQVFSKSVERLIQVFASQAAAAIYNAKISKQNKEFWETRRGDSLALTVSEIVVGLAHNAGHRLNEVANSFGLIEKILSKDRISERQWESMKQEVEQAKVPMTKLQEDFQRLTSYRRFDKMRIEKCEINPLVRLSLDMLRDPFKRQRVVIDARYAPGEPTVMCDENQIIHVLVNLYLNALEAMVHKGKLTVTMSVNKQNEEVEIRISDTGPGIPRELRDKIFDPAFSTKKHGAGSGYGLPISRHILIEHGGRIQLGPSSTKGATFYVYLKVNN